MVTEIEADFIIRVMRPEDVNAVLAIDRLSFSTAWDKSSYLRDLINPICQYFVADRDGQVFAYCGLWIVREDSHVTTIAVHPDWRHQGLGRTLMLKMIDYALQHGSTRMTLEVSIANPSAKTLYDKLGFITIGKIKAYYLDSGEDAWVMRLEPLRMPGTPP